MKFSLDDRHRSLRRFVMNALGSPPWKVRTEREPVKDEDRPVAVVEVTTPAATLWSRTSMPQGDVQRGQTFTLTLYPELKETPAESGQVAREVAELLANAIGFGLVGDDGELLSPPERIPVYDFAGVAMSGPNRAGPADAYGWLDVADFPVRPIQDPEDPLRWTVVCDLRLTWWQGGRLRAGAAEPPVVAEIVPVPPGGEPGVPEEGVPPTTEWPGGMTGVIAP